MGTRMQAGRRRALAACVNVIALLALTLGSPSIQTAAAEGESVTVPTSLVAEFPVEGSNFGTALGLGAEGAMWFTQAAPGRLDRITTGGVVNAEDPIPLNEQNFPEGIALGKEGAMWFADNAIDKEDNPHSYLGYATPQGLITMLPLGAGVGYVVDVAVGTEGDIWFSSSTGGGIGKMSPTSHEVTTFPVSGEPGDLAPSTPAAVAVGPGGNVWFTDPSESSSEQSYVGRVTPSGNVRTFPIPQPFGYPQGIAQGADGNMWFTEFPDALGRVTPEGEITEYIVPALAQSIHGIALGPDGDIWFTERNDALGRITPAGKLTNFTGVLAEGQTPEALARGVGADLWYTEGALYQQGPEHVGRLVVPFAPANKTLPAVSGSAAEGQTLTATAGSWSNQPRAITLQWQVCDQSGSSCTNLPGQTATTHELSASEVGHTLRVAVTASNIAGSETTTSSATPVVSAIAHSPAIVPELPSVAPPIVEASVKWKFARARRYLVVERMQVTDIPPGAWLEVMCNGRGCPFARTRIVPGAHRRAACHHARCRLARRPSSDHMSIQSLFDGRRLRVGTRIVVDILKAGWVGKSFAYTVRENAKPGERIACVAANSESEPSEC
jgi:virginiamycin B lyase